MLAKTLDTPVDRWLRSAGFSTATLGLVVLIGWHFGLYWIIQLSPKFAPMQRNTAAGFILCGAALALSLGSRFERGAGRLCGLISGMTGLATLAEDFFKKDLHIDLILGHAGVLAHAPQPGRMSILTATCFFLIGTARVMDTGKVCSRRTTFVIAIAGTLVSAISIASLFSYLLGASSVWGWTAVTWMAAHTAACFSVLGLSVIAHSWEMGTAGRTKTGLSARAPSWTPLSVGIGAGTLLLSLIQSVLSNSTQSGVVHTLGLIGGVSLTLLLVVIVPMEFKHRIAAGLGIALTVLIFTAFFSFRTLEREQDSQAWVAHTNAVLLVAHEVKDDLVTADAHSRGYFWSGETKELEGWRIEAGRARVDLDRLRALTIDNSAQQLALDRIDIVFAKTVAVIELRIDIHEQSGQNAALASFQRSRGWTTLEPMNAMLATFRDEENKLLRNRTETAARNLVQTKIVVTMGNALAFLFLGAAGVIATSEIRARKRASEEEFRLLVSGIKDYAILMLDPDGLVLSWNEGAERIKGYSGEEIIGQHFSQFYPAEDVEQGKPAAEMKVAVEKGQFEDEGWRLRNDGSRFWADVLLTALPDDKGGLRGFGMVTRDSTERKREKDEVLRLNTELEQRVAERTAELTEANHELEAFTYTAAHDLRAPLRHMHGFVEFLRQDWYERLDSEGRRYLDKIAASSKDMGMLLDDLLNFSRLGRTDMRRSRVSLSELVTRIRRELEPECKDRALTWRIEELPEVIADPNLFHQVFFNLMANAVKYTRKCENAHIEVGSSTGDTGITVFVRDNGAGFEMEYVNKLFGVFQRLHKSQDFEGTGIGLAIVRRIVERHGGKVWAEGKPGKGATFYFSMPVSEA